MDHDLGAGHRVGPPDCVGDEEAPAAERLFPQQRCAVAEHVVDDRLEDRPADVVGGPGRVAQLVGFPHQLHDGPAAPGLAERLALLLLQAQEPRAEVVALPSIVEQLALVGAAHAGAAVRHACRSSTVSTPVQSSGRLYPLNGATSTPE